MAICSWCKQEMKTASTCECNKIMIDGVIYKPVKYGEEQVKWTSERCHDCNIEKGGYHHPGCDIEECPRCHGQIISCGCLDEDEEKDES